MVRGSTRRRGGGGGGQSIGNIFDMKVNLIELGSGYFPLASSGVYAFAGNHMAVQTQMENYAFVDQKHSATFGRQLTQASVSIIGAKVLHPGECCRTLTMTFACLIFPLFFMCCGWWKKLVYPSYEVRIETYEALGHLLNSSTAITNLNLIVVDNAFNAEKAAVLYRLISGSKLTGFTFNNQAIAASLKGSQYDDFAKNMAPIKKLPISTVIQWDGNVIQ